jgi:hypothetical protein
MTLSRGAATGPLLSGRRIVSPAVSPFRQQRKTISNNIAWNHEKAQELTCIIEGCNSPGKEMIALLDEASFSGVPVHQRDAEVVFEGSNFDKKGWDNDNTNETDLIPAVVCGKHFDKLIEAYYCQDRSSGGNNK